MLEVEVDFIVQEGIDPLFAAALDRHFMRSLARHPRGAGGVLRVYECRGDLFSLGRYNLAPCVGERGTGGLSRRHCGGRPVPFGEGFVGLSLILPHRSALFSPDPFHLAPYQVINRYVRGLLEACTAFGIAAFYPGRDLVTVGRGALATVSFETDERGILLLEAIIGNSRDFSTLPSWLDDPQAQAGSVKGRVAPLKEATSLAAQLGTTLAVAEVAEEIRRSFARQFSLCCNPRKLSPLEVQAAQVLANRQLGAGQWVLERRIDADLERCGSATTQLGSFEVYLSLQGRSIIKRAQLAGDFIANSPAILELERGLRFCQVKWEAVEAVVQRVFSKPHNFILGVGRLRTIVDTVLRGAA